MDHPSLLPTRELLDAAEQTREALRWRRDEVYDLEARLAAVEREMIARVRSLDSALKHVSEDDRKRRHPNYECE